LQERFESLQKEISIMKRLDHPNVVKLHYVLENTTKGKVSPNILLRSAICGCCRA
jgi:serine/threonine protein kinase